MRRNQLVWGKDFPCVFSIKPVYLRKPEETSMAKIKDSAAAAAKWARRTSNASAEYTEGIKNPRKDWAAETKAAEDNFEQGIIDAIADKRFGKGVARTGTAGWQEAALSKGPARFSAGVQGAEGKYEAGFAPYRTAIENLTLPPRGPKGSAQNIERVKIIADTLHKVKRSRA